MNDSKERLPERLHVAGATDLERRVLNAARRERPSAELSQRMAHGIGISASGLSLDGTNPAEGAPSPTAVAGAPAKVALGSKFLIPGVTGAVVLTAVAVAIGIGRPSASVGEREERPSASVSVPETPPVPVVAEREATDRTETVGASDPKPVPEVVAPTRRERGTRASTASPDLREQIALLDAARSALSGGSGDRALDAVRKYQAKYPAGSFHPEATALKIEALDKLGRRAEARGLAERFIAEQGRTALAKRVARIVGLESP